MFDEHFTLPHRLLCCLILFHSGQGRQSDATLNIRSVKCLLYPGPEISVPQDGPLHCHMPPIFRNRHTPSCALALISEYGHLDTGDVAPCC